MVTLQLRQLNVPPGQLTYDNEILEIMTPLPEHEDNKEILGDLIKALLEELDSEFRTLGSTTFKNQLIRKGIEPDQCFYIQNEAKIRGKKRLDLSIDPPPDLAIEIDMTSRTHPDTYAALGVPELWRLEGDTLQINRLEKGKYVQVEQSPTCPDIPIGILVDYLKQSRVIGRIKVIKAFRQWIKQQYSD